MRLQLTAVFSCLLLSIPSSSSGAAHDVRVRTDVYGDQWVVVVSPAAAASVDLGERWNVGAGLSVDVLSGATPIFTTDAVTAATGFSDERYGPSANLTFSALPSWRITTSYGASVEHDHLAHAPALSSEVEVLDRTATLGIAYSFLHEEVWRRQEPDARQITRGHRVDLSWVHLLARRTVLSVIGTLDGNDCQERLGCHANPYRFVPLVEDDDSIVAMSTERHPGQRLRGAASLRLAQGFEHAIGLHVGYRYAADTWQVHGHTADVGLARTFAEGRLVGRVEGRFTHQAAAAFFRDDYRTDAADPAVPDFRTGDPELSRLVDAMAALRLQVRPPPVGPAQLTVGLRGAYVHHRYLNMRDRPRRHAWLVGLGVGVEL